MMMDVVRFSTRCIIRITANIDNCDFVRHGAESTDERRWFQTRQVTIAVFRDDIVLIGKSLFISRARCLCLCYRSTRRRTVCCDSTKRAHATARRRCSTFSCLQCVRWHNRSSEPRPASSSYIHYSHYCSFIRRRRRSQSMPSIEAFPSELSAINGNDTSFHSVVFVVLNKK